MELGRGKSWQSEHQQGAVGSGRRGGGQGRCRRAVAQCAVASLQRGVRALLGGGLALSLRNYYSGCGVAIHLQRPLNWGCMLVGSITRPVEMKPCQIGVLLSRHWPAAGNGKRAAGLTSSAGPQCSGAPPPSAASPLQLAGDTWGSAGIAAGRLVAGDSASVPYCTSWSTQVIMRFLPSLPLSVVLFPVIPHRVCVPLLVVPSTLPPSTLSASVYRPPPTTDELLNFFLYSGPMSFCVPVCL